MAVAPLFVIVKSPWNPELQSCDTRNVISTDPTCKLTLGLPGVGVGAGVAVGVGVAVGAGVGVAVGAGVGVGAGAEASRITRSVGKVLKFPGAAVNPKETVPPTGTALLQLGAAMVYFWPVRDWMLPFQIEEIAGAIVKSTRQSEIGLPVVFVTVTSAWNPLPQSFVTVKAA